MRLTITQQGSNGLSNATLSHFEVGNGVFGNALNLLGCLQLDAYDIRNPIDFNFDSSSQIEVISARTISL